MIHPEILEKYRRIRREHPTMSSKGALHYARAEPIEKIDWKKKDDPDLEIDWDEVSFSDPVKITKIERDGFTCYIAVVYDNDYDWTDSRGKFTDKREPGALDNPNGYKGWNFLKYFVPENSVEYHREALIKLGCSKQEAQVLAEKWVHEDMKIAADPEKEGYAAYGIIATVMLEGVEFGEDSLWGIEINNSYNPYLNSDDSYLDEVAFQCLNEALYHAKKELAEAQAAPLKEESTTHGEEA